MLKPFSSPQYEKRTRMGESGNECCLCGRETSGLEGAIHVAVNHECAEFVTDQEAEELGSDIVSLYPIGPECVKKWHKAVDGTSVRLRQTRDGIVGYDERAA